MTRASAVPLLVTLVLALSACTDQGLVDRVAQLEQADQRLRESLTALGAPDPDAEAAAEATRAELDEVAERIARTETAIEAMQADLDAQVLDLDDRLTAADLAREELRTEVTQLSADLRTLTDRVSSLEAQLDAHRSDPSGHAG